MLGSIELTNDNEKFIIIELEFSSNVSLKVSIINNREYTTLPNYKYFKEACELLIKLNKEYRNLILDVGPHELYIKQFINEHKLNFIISNPTKEQVRDMSETKLSLIGFYIHGRYLVKNDSLI